MLSTFVIGLREGLEAALIVGIVAAFLKQRGRTDLLRLVWVGVGLAALICLGVGLGLHAFSADLPQRQQEGLETVVGFIAVAMVTYMVIWMRRHSRELKKQLEGAADSALQSGSGLALVAMAFLAVFREGFETAVFLLAAFNETANPATAGAGAVLGLAVAVVLGYGIYRGGVRINLSKFFRFTGAVLVLVAAGLVVNGLHTAHEAGWLNLGQGRTFDLSWLVAPGSVRSSLLTGMLGWQPQPVVIELVGWLAYLVPVGLYVAWPPGRTVSRRLVLRTAAAVTATALVAGAASSAATPSRPAQAAADSAVSLSGHGGLNGAGTLRLHRVERDAGRLVVAASGAVPGQTWALASVGPSVLDGVPVRTYRAQNTASTVPTGRPTHTTITGLTALAGGRLPLGVTAASEPASIPLTYRVTSALRVAVDAGTGRVLSAAYTRITAISAALSIGTTTVATVQDAALTSSTGSAASALRAARADDRQADQRDRWRSLAVVAWIVAVAGAVVGAVAFVRRRPEPSAAPARRVTQPAAATFARGATFRPEP